MSVALEKFFEEMRSHPSFENHSVIDSQAENSLGETALHFATILNNIEIVRELLSCGAEPNQKGEHGFTPLHEAVQQGNKEIVRLLLESGADTSIKNSWNQDSLELAELDDSEEGAEEIKVLLQATSSN